MTKDNVALRYKEFINQLELAKKSLISIHGANKEINEYKDSLCQRLGQMIAQSEEDAHIVLDKIPWDRLVIAFFGETNAGKSTIIETARILFTKNRVEGNDGIIIGDGQGDFTKDYNHYNLEINGRPFTLIDVPGIEGNEKEYTEGIKDALKYAHIVFYVQEGGKKPDEAVANNIKKYLSEWVDVYVLQNVRGGAMNYDMEEDRVSLFEGNQGKDVAKVKEQIRKVFKDLLGNNFKDVVTVQGLLALCSKASFSPKREKDLGKQQKKLFRYFETGEKMFAFSEYESIISLISKKSSNFTDEISKSTINKISALARRTKQNIDEVLEGNKLQIDGLESKLRQFNRDISTICNNTQTSIRNSVRNAIDKEFISLKNDVFGYIENSGKDIEQKINNRANRLSLTLKHSIDDVVREKLTEMKMRLSEKQKELQGVRINVNQNNSFSFNGKSVDLGGVMVELNFNLDDFGDYAISTAGLAGTGAAVGSLVPVVGTIVGASVGAVIGFMGKLFFGNTKEKKLAAAKKEVSDAIAEARSDFRNSADICLNDICNNIKSSSRAMQKSVNDEIDRIKKLNEVISQLQSKMDQTVFVSNL